MAALLSPEFWARLIGIGVLNLLLSGDNALVIALAVRLLPRRQRVLGQVWGASGAVVLRLAFVAVVSLLLRIPLLRALGGALLVWIAVRLVRSEEGEVGAVRHGATLWEAIWIIIVADVTMSLDNILAIAAAAHGDMVLVSLGVGVSLPLVVWGAGVLATLMNRYPWIVWAGGGVLGYVAGEMLVGDPLLSRWLGGRLAMVEHPVPFVMGVAVAALGWWLSRAARPDDGAPGRT